MMVKRAAISASVLLIALLMGGETAVAQKEYLIKAALLKHLGDPAHVTWPNDPQDRTDDKFRIGVFGRNVFAGRLEAILENQRTDDGEEGRSIEVHSFESFDQYRDCHLLFIPHDPVDTFENRLRIATKRTQGAPVLIVGDVQGSARRGAAISFYIASNRVRLEANLREAKARKLELTDKLLNLPQVTRVDE